MSDIERKQLEDNVDYLFALADVNCVAVTTLSDGVALIFKKNTLKQILEKYQDREEIVILIQNPGKKEQN